MERQRSTRHKGGEEIFCLMTFQVRVTARIKLGTGTSYRALVAYNLQVSYLRSVNLANLSTKSL